MTSTSIHNSHGRMLNRRLTALLASRVVAVLESVAAWRRRIKSHREMAHLTRDQLMDIGYAPERELDPRPVIEIKAGLMANLMSMR